MAVRLKRGGRCGRVCVFEYHTGEKRLAKALVDRPGLEVDVRWRPFQLQPGMPKAGLPWAEFSRRKFGGESGAEAAKRATAILEERHELGISILVG